jgi:hypothetical protein
MDMMSKTTLRSLLAVAVLASTALPASARAQGGTLPSYATREDRIQGTISGFNGPYTVYVRDDRGYVDNVTLRSGTVINPTGLRLEVGQRVTILGFAQGKTFVANEIDAPYARWPVYGYVLPPPYWYGPVYPYYGPYYYGPWIRVGVIFGPRFYVRGWRYYFGRPWW